MNPLPTAAHGRRARYVQGCRCGLCRTANRLAHQRNEQRKKTLAADLPLSHTGWCLGVDGEGCPWGVKLYSCSGPVCGRCRDRYAFNGLVDARPVRSHLKALQRRGVGLRAIEAATDIPRCILHGLRKGTRTRLRAQAARKLLDVDTSCLADRATVPASRTWWQIHRLLADGYPARRLAKWLGYRGDGLQLNRVRITARNALRVDKLYRWLMAADQS